MASVDYATSRVYFASRRSGGVNPSLWCLDLGPSSDALRLGWSRDLGTDVDGSPVLRGGRVYVVDNIPSAWSIPASTGSGGTPSPSAAPHSRRASPSPTGATATCTSPPAARSTG